MRRLPLNQITNEMQLARPIYHNNRLILNKGTKNLSHYVKGLNNLGIFSVYIEDSFSDGIEIQDAISEETLNECRMALASAFDSLLKQGNFNIEKIDETIDSIIDELFSREDILVSLNQISSISDNTFVHSINTTVLSLLIGKELGLSRSEMKKLSEGAILHDIGKIALDQSILFKAGRLTDEEFNHIKLHPEYGYEIVKKNPLLTESARQIALQHHERMDGSGYPKGLTSDEIHLFGKIVAIADMFDALTTERCYRKSMSNFHAYKILTNDASNNKIDSTLLALLLKNVAIYPNGIIVHLSDGSMGVVKSQNPELPFHPVVRVIKNDGDSGQVAIFDVDLKKSINLTIVEPD